MGSMVGKLQRKIRRFNIDNRARAVISQEKPTPAPHYESVKKQLKLAQEATPDFLEKHYQKNLQLDENLKKVYVTCEKPKEDIFSEPDPNRPLPKSRISEDLEFGFYVPDQAPVGKCTLRQIFQLIIQHKEDSDKYDVDTLATQYKLDTETVVKLLEYYKLYSLYMPEKEAEDTCDPKINAITDNIFNKAIGKKEE